MSKFIQFRDEVICFRKDCERHANRVRSSFPQSKVRPVPVQDLCEWLGVSVLDDREAKWLAGSLVRKDGAAIFYNGNGLSGEEVRFIVAYELGHVLLSKTEIAHMHLSVSPFAAHGDDLRVVYFAVGLLVPEDELRHQVDIVGLSEGALGLKFGVSADVVKHRVTSLHWRWS